MLKDNIPFYEECKFGYYEWFVEKTNDEVVIHKVPTLAPFRKIISDASYKLDIYCLLELKNKERFLSREEAYKLVKKYWKNNSYRNYLGYLKIKRCTKNNSFWTINN